MSLCVSLSVRGASVLLVGGGNVALRKAKLLKQEGAMLHVIAPDICEELKQLATSYEERGASIQDVHDIFLLVAASNDEELNQTLIKFANQHQILSMGVHQDTQANLHALSVIETDDYLFACSTKGSYPLYGKKILQEFTHYIEDQHLHRLQLLATLRKHILTIHPCDKQELCASLLQCNEAQLAFLCACLHQTGHILVFHGVKDAQALQDIEIAIHSLYTRTQAPVSFAYAAKAVLAVRPEVFDIEQLCKLCTQLQCHIVLHPMFLQQGAYTTSITALVKQYHIPCAELPFQAPSKQLALLQHLCATYRCEQEAICIILHGGREDPFLHSLQRCATQLHHVEVRHEKGALPHGVKQLPLFVLYGKHAQAISTKRISCFADPVLLEMVLKHCIEQIRAFR